MQNMQLTPLEEDQQRIQEVGGRISRIHKNVISKNRISFKWLDIMTSVHKAADNKKVEMAALVILQLILYLVLFLVLLPLNVTGKHKKIRQIV